MGSGIDDEGDLIAGMALETARQLELQQHRGEHRRGRITQAHKLVHRHRSGAMIRSRAWSSTASPGCVGVGPSQGGGSVSANGRLWRLSNTSSTSAADSTSTAP